MKKIIIIMVFLLTILVGCSAGLADDWKIDKNLNETGWTGTIIENIVQDPWWKWQVKLENYDNKVDLEFRGEPGYSGISFEDNNMRYSFGITDYKFDNWVSIFNLDDHELKTTDNGPIYNEMKEILICEIHKSDGFLWNLVYPECRNYEVK